MSSERAQVNFVAVHSPESYSQVSLMKYLHRNGDLTFGNSERLELVVIGMSGRKWRISSSSRSLRLSDEAWLAL